jgi:hypothetical protein
MKLIVMGHSRHGKDYVAELLGETFGLTSVSSSWWAALNVVYPKLQELAGDQAPPYYQTLAECYADRHNHRKMWFDMIREYTRSDPTRLGREILRDFHIYVGIRNHREFHALRNMALFDAAIWVDASERVPPESKDSCTVEPWMADYVLDNNGTLAELHTNVVQLMTTLQRKFPQ